MCIKRFDPNGRLGGLREGEPNSGFDYEIKLNRKVISWQLFVKMKSKGSDLLNSYLFDQRWSKCVEPCFLLPLRKLVFLSFVSKDLPAFLCPGLYCMLAKLEVGSSCNFSCIL